MVDFVVDLSIYEFDLLIRDKLDNLSYSPGFNYWLDSRWNRYKHNWTYENVDINDFEYGFYIGYSLNIKEEYANRFRISYNPNKVPSNDPLLSFILNIIKVLDVKVSKCDIAFDYEGITTSDLTFDKGRKREFKIFSYSDTDYTYYLGKSGINGAVKIYDKASEEGKKQEYNKTRYEITLEPNILVKDIEKYKCIVSFPKLYFNGIFNFYDNESFSDTDKTLIYAINNGYPIEKLSYRNRKKYEKIVGANNVLYTEIEPEQSQAEQALKKFIIDLFYI